jgi:hypothetical protein
MGQRAVRVGFACRRRLHLAARMGFHLLGLADYCLAHPRDHAAVHIRLDLGERLHQRLLACETDEWVWFEDRLTYDNARLCEALIITGKAIGRDDWTQAGLRALRWLIELQTAPAGYFRPVGSHGFLWCRALRLCRLINSPSKPAPPWRPALPRCRLMPLGLGWQRRTRPLPGSPVPMIWACR